MTDPLRDAQHRLEQKRRAAGIPLREVPKRVEPPAGDKQPHGEEAGDAFETLLSEAEVVTVAYVDECRRLMWRRDTWLVRVRIVEGEHSGRLLAWFMRALDRGRPVARGSVVATSYVAAIGLRPPRDLARRRPSWWLADAFYRVSTRQVRRDVHGIERPEAASYSVVVAILERVAGAPPALRERRP